MGNAVTVNVVEYILNNVDFSSSSSSSNLSVKEEPNMGPKFMLLHGNGWSRSPSKKRKKKKGNTNDDVGTKRKANKTKQEEATTTTATTTATAKHVTKVKIFSL